MFLLKKYVSALLYPLPIGFLVLLSGVLLLWFGRRPSWGRILCTAALVWIYVFSAGPLPEWGIRSLESGYEIVTPQTVRDVRWIVVLGGGIASDPRLPANEQLSDGSLKRTVEAVRLLQQRPQARVLFSGGRVFGTKAEAAGMRELAVQLGIDPSRIAVEDQSRDTEEQAVNVGRMVGKEPFLLVTSAWHLPRSMALFEGQGLQPVPAPADIVLKPGRKDWRHYVPDVEGLEKSTAAFHEYLGRIWSWMRGRT